VSSPFSKEPALSEANEKTERDFEQKLSNHHQEGIYFVYQKPITLKLTSSTMIRFIKKGGYKKRKPIAEVRCQ